MFYSEEMSPPQELSNFQELSNNPTLIINDESLSIVPKPNLKKADNKSNSSSDKFEVDSDLYPFED